MAEPKYPGITMLRFEIRTAEDDIVAGKVLAPVGGDIAQTFDDGASPELRRALGVVLDGLWYLVEEANASDGELPDLKDLL